MGSAQDHVSAINTFEPDAGIEFPSQTCELMIQFSITRDMAQCQMGINGFGRIPRLVFRATMGSAQDHVNAVSAPFKSSDA